MISQSCEIDHSEGHCGGGRHKVSHICQARSPDKNLGATDPRAPVNRDRCIYTKQDYFLATCPADNLGRTIDLSG